ncbi:MAG: DUF3662 domain-containing protein [Pelotomaculum sp.]|uniref:Hypothetical signaling protein n=1 Tax=Pelotomaculum thermopropionicum (strain DSM 13744 / JCM 10971 / SI) TaxID=370438 RepID=A5D1B5_PELTS|nr:DUF3662 domain-containing protein [Pelotomaculum sp.]BAF59967.1 hypothetical signaling protein [Pelotomaculum thermopropionicum SI]
MRLFSDLEGSLEKYIEGFFKDKFGGRIQPVEIAKKLAREMRDARRVSISNIYVPNRYNVHLHPSDWENISQFASLLSGELQEYIRQKAEEKKYTLAGPPDVKFSRDETVPSGGMKVESEFGAIPSGEGGLEAGESIENTQRFVSVRDSFRMEAPAPVHGYLQVKAGPDRGKVFKLGDISMIIGRREGCDIVLNDSSVSRRHARLELHRGRYTITDLGSTNGTMVNGVRINSKALEPGDVITLGTTVFIFKVE